MLTSLAWCELYLVFEACFRFFVFELYKTDITDVELTQGFFSPVSKT